MASKLEKLQLERDQLNARIQQLAAREREAAKKRDTKRRVLIGAFVQQRLQDGKPAIISSMDGLVRELDGWLTRPSDRAVFGLAPLPKPEKKPEPPPSPSRVSESS